MNSGALAASESPTYCGVAAPHLCSLRRKESQSFDGPRLRDFGIATSSRIWATRGSGATELRLDGVPHSLASRLAGVRLTTLSDVGNPQPRLRTRQSRAQATPEAKVLESRGRPHPVSTILSARRRTSSPRWREIREAQSVTAELLHGA